MSTPRTPGHPRCLLGERKGEAALLIFINAFAAASSFVGAILVAGRAPDLLAIPTFIVGFIGLGYFLKRAERHHESRRRP